jgi:hypothetical protein
MMGFMRPAIFSGRMGNVRLPKLLPPPVHATYVQTDCNDTTGWQQGFWFQISILYSTVLRGNSVKGDKGFILPAIFSHRMEKVRPPKLLPSPVRATCNSKNPLNKKLL